MNAEASRASDATVNGPPVTDLAGAAQRRADLAVAAARGAADVQLVLQSDPESLALLGVSEDSPLLADVLRWQGSILRDQGKTDEAETLYQRSLRVAQH